MKGYLIHVTAQTIGAVEFANSTELRALVGARYLDVAKAWPDGTTLYVDDEGLGKPPFTGFMVPGNCWPLCSNGMVVGPELPDEEQPGMNSDIVKTRDPGISIEDLRAEVTFMTEAEVRRWVLANDKEPAVVVSGTVVATVGQAYNNPDDLDLPF